jgi:hypothetical protein
VGGYVGTLDHETHVAQSACVHNGLEVTAFNAVQFFGFRLVDKIKKFWKTITQIKATPTAMAYVEDPPHFQVKLVCIVIVLLSPAYGVAGWST